MCTICMYVHVRTCTVGTYICMYICMCVCMHTMCLTCIYMYFAYKNSSTFISHTGGIFVSHWA